jgi:hypothetical protein
MHRQWWLLPILALSLLYLNAPASLRAQEVRASLTGTVSDSSGAVVVGASLTLQNEATGVRFTSNSNEAGKYSFLFLNPGSYVLTASMAGFRTFERKNIVLDINRAGGIDIALEVGNQTETMTVTSEAPLLDTEKADRGTVLPDTSLAELPSNMRNPIMEANYANGIAQTSNQTNNNPFANSGLSAWSINGTGTNQTEFQMDGAPNNTVFTGLNTVAYVPPMDAVQEFKIDTGSYDAQYGHGGGGVLNVSTKSGTNSFHGSAYEFLKRKAFDANTFTNNAHGYPITDDRLDQWGFTVGGPVWIPKVYNGRDKTFFFFGYEKYAENVQFPADDQASVPTVAQKSGDFSKTFNSAGKLITIYDPASGHDVNGTWTRNPFSLNQIPSNKINATGQKIANLYPDPNQLTAGSVDWQNNYYFAGTPEVSNLTTYRFQNFVSRVDHVFNQKERVFARWSWNNLILDEDQQGFTGFGGDNRHGGKFNHGGVIDSVTVLSPSLVLDFHVALTRWYQNLTLRYPHTYSATQIGWPQSTVNQLQTPDRAPYFDVGQYTYLGQSNSNFQFEPTNVLSLQPNIAWLHGRHTLKAGVDLRVTRYSRFNPTYSGGQLAFSQGFTQANYLTGDSASGNAVASMLLGAAASGTVSLTLDPAYQWVYLAPWVQDDIHVTRRLTVSLGLRWDRVTPITERYNQLNRGFDVNAVNPISSLVNQANFPGYKVYGGLGFVGVNGNPRSPYNNDNNNIQPRVGFAFMLNQKTVMRGGWGLYYVNPADVASANGFTVATPYVASLDSNKTSSGDIANPFPNGLIQPTGARAGLSTFLGLAPSFADPTGKVPYVHQFSLGFQRQLPGRMTLDVSYAGSRTDELWVTKGFNALSKANLALGDVNQGGSASYLNAQVANPFAGLLPGTTINNSTVARSQLLLPFPEFVAFNESSRNDGHTWYNALQASLRKNMSHGLTFMANYTLSKTIQATSYLNPQDDKPGRSLAAWDVPQRLAITPMYELPFGPGRALLNGHNGLLSRLIGGWNINVVSIITTGMPMGIPSNVTVIGDPHLANPTWNRLFKTGYINTDGSVHNVQSGESPVFAIRQPNTLRTTPDRWGNLRNRWANTIDAALIKKTRIREGMTAEFGMEWFNALNTPVFYGNPVLTPTDPSFGAVIRDNGQSNSPRQIQIRCRFTF